VFESQSGQIFLRFGGPRAFVRASATSDQQLVFWSFGDWRESASQKFNVQEDPHKQEPSAGCNKQFLVGLEGQYRLVVITSPQRMVYTSRARLAHKAEFLSRPWLLAGKI
jgi:hypothetical protein